VSKVSHKQQNSLVPQPLHSSDPSRVDFLLFPKLNVSLTGCQFESLDKVQEKPPVLLTNISENCAWIAEENGKIIGIISY